MKTAYNLLVKYFWGDSIFPYSLLAIQNQVYFTVSSYLYLFIFAFFLPLKVLNTSREGKANIHLCIPYKPSTEWPWGPLCWAEQYCSILTRTRKYAGHCSLPILHGVLAKLKTNIVVIWLSASLLVLLPLETDQDGVETVKTEPPVSAQEMLCDGLAWAPLPYLSNEISHWRKLASPDCERQEAALRSSVPGGKPEN